MKDTSAQYSAAPATETKKKSKLSVERVESVALKSFNVSKDAFELIRVYAELQKEMVKRDVYVLIFRVVGLLVAAFLMVLGVGVLNVLGIYVLNRQIPNFELWLIVFAALDIVLGAIVALFIYKRVLFREGEGRIGTWYKSLKDGEAHEQGEL